MIHNITALMFRLSIIAVVAAGIGFLTPELVRAVDTGCTTEYPICVPGSSSVELKDCENSSGCWNGSEDGVACCKSEDPEPITPSPSPEATSAPPPNICQQAGNPVACTDCQAQDGVWTALGCVPTGRTALTSTLLTIAIGASGGVILLRVLQASLILSTSQGDPNKTKEAKDIITSSVMGLLFIVFSIVMLNTIGENILQLPGF